MYKLKPNAFTSARLPWDRILFLGLLVFAFIGYLFPSYSTSQVIGVFGFIISIIILWIYGSYSFRFQSNLGLTVLVFSCIFWFWKEVFILASYYPSFEDIADYSPFSLMRIPADIVAESLISLILFQFFAINTWYFLGRFKFKLFYVFYSKKKPFFIDIILLFLAILGWIPFSKQFGSFKASLIKLSSMRSEEIELDPSIINYLPIVAIVASSFALSRLIVSNNRNKIICVLTFLIGGLIAFLSGTRFKLIFLVMPTLLSLIMVDNSKLSKARKITIFFTTLTILLAFGLYQILNRYGVNSYSTNNNTLAVIAGSDHFSALTHAVAISRNLQEFFHQLMLPQFITDFIPRMFWPDKPIQEFWEYYNSKLALAGNVTPSVVGQYFLNWGVLGGLIAGINFGIWARIADNLINIYRKTKNELYLIASTFLLTFIFLSFRVYSFNYFFYVLIMGGLFLLFSKRRKII